MSSKQPERSLQFLLGMESNRVVASMYHQSEEERLANDFGKSDSRIVPQHRTDQIRETKLGNSSAGKATKLSRETSRPLTRPSVGDSVLSRLNRITDRAKSNTEEVFNNLFSDYAYLKRNPLAGPTRLTDLIARGRTLAAVVQR